ncbi:hypothetical protein [Romboutsia timonensis]|uniref:hypothetical protein n=1 Tax=Romboutsia timonensis TaxID=1776391 RepID=UPI0008DA334C|nr:hypothetical protein [Romboutsia timonensis]
MKSKKTGMSMTGTKNVFIERKKQEIKPIGCACDKCLYYNREIYRFGKATVNRKHCIKFTLVEGYNDNRNNESNKKRIRNNENKIYKQKRI